MEPVSWFVQLIVGIAISGTIGFIVATLGMVGVILAWVLAGAVILAYALRRRGSREARKRLSELKPVPRERSVCDAGPHEIEGGEFEYLPLDVAVEEHIQGRLEEVDGDDFDWYILDETSLVAFQNGEEFDYVRGNDHVSADVVDWVVDDAGPWFLLLTLIKRLNPRRIRVKLRIV